MANYKIPFPVGIEVRIATPKGEYAHENFPESRYARDFLLDAGTKILAAREGTVSKLKSDSNLWGVAPSLANHANYIAIDHGDGTFAEYIHFGHNQIVVAKNQIVSAGQLLGYSGHSGFMDVPHLHFNLFKIEKEKPISIPSGIFEAS